MWAVDRYENEVIRATDEALKRGVPLPRIAGILTGIVVGNVLTSESPGFQSKAIALMIEELAYVITLGDLPVPEIRRALSIWLATKEAVMRAGLTPPAGGHVDA